MLVNAEVIAAMSLIMILGLSYCLLGSRFFRLIFTATAFAAGLVITYSLAGVQFSTFIARAAISITGGLLAALILNIFSFLGRFLVGLLAAVTAGVLLVSVFQLAKVPYVWDIILVLGLAAGICAFQKTVIVRCATAFMGAFLVTIVGFYGIFHGINSADFSSVQAMQKTLYDLIGGYPYYTLLAVGVLTAGGIVFQFWQSLRYVPSPAELSPAALLLPSFTRGKGDKNYVGRHLG